MSVPQTSKLRTRLRDSIVESTAAYQSQQQRIRAYHTLQGTTVAYHSPPESSRALYDESQPQIVSDATIVYRNKTLPERTRAYQSLQEPSEHTAT